ncbi:MAG: hypothetical protein LBJ77_02340, partial [Holosporales bacterium]|nr:hypothetical protein [Holosporales bacterium]
YKPEDIVNSLDAYVTGMKNKIERYRALIKVTGVAAAGVGIVALCTGLFRKHKARRSFYRFGRV